jgi:hypothetical protein
MTDHYAGLKNVLNEAFEQAASGKGKTRHGQDLIFERQPMQRLLDLYGPGFAAGQIGKKTQEALRLQTDMAVQELLGAIVYAAGLVIWLRTNRAPENVVLGDEPGLDAVLEEIVERRSRDEKLRAAAGMLARPSGSL